MRKAVVNTVTNEVVNVIEADENFSAPAGYILVTATDNCSAGKSVWNGVTFEDGQEWVAAQAAINAEAIRVNAFQSDAGCIDTLDKMSNMTFAQFDQWFTDNVTTLAQARTALKRLAWVVLLLYKRKI
jgi:hypothetical protein